MRALLLSIAVGCLSFSASADAQLYGITPYQNGPAPDQGSVFVYDPDTLTWLDSVSLLSNAGAVLSGSGLAVHPVLPPPNDALNGKLYALLRLSSFSNTWLTTLDLATGAATPIAQLSDQYAAITFTPDGRLFGVTADDASNPEVLFEIDKQSGAQTWRRSLGIGQEGELIAYNPEAQQLYHWSGAASVFLEKITTDLYLTTSILIQGSTRGETVGAVWDPCLPRTVGANAARGFIAANGSQTFDYWRSSGELGPAPGAQPDVSRGLALIGGYTCDADLNVTLASPNAAPAPGSPLTVTVSLSNAGQARAMMPVLTIAPPANLSGITTSGCQEDPAGIPTCTPRILTNRYDIPSAQYVPFQLASLWRGRSVSVTLQGTYSNGTGTFQVSASSASNELQPADNQASLRLGDELLRNGFED